MTDIYPYPGLSRRSSGFLPKLVEISERLRVNPNHLLAVMQLESGIDPAIQNPSGGATGLIQFMPATARALGTTTDALRSMSDVDQLSYVFAYFAPYAGRLNSAGDVYLVTFYPKALGKGPDYVIGEQNAEGLPGRIYAQNRGLDVDGDGRITAHDVTRKAETMAARYAGGPPVTVPGAGRGARLAALGALVGYAAVIGLVYLAGSFMAAKQRAA